MDDFNTPRSCGGRPARKERYVAEMGYGVDERAILAIARHYFLTFADPASQAWMRAQMLARCTFEGDHGHKVSDAVLSFVRELRMARNSSFRFSNPDCPGCANILCECERQIMGVIIAVRRNQPSSAHGHALLLCEGNNIDGLLEAADDVASALADANQCTPELETHEVRY